MEDVVGITLSKMESLLSVNLNRRISAAQRLDGVGIPIVTANVTIASTTEKSSIISGAMEDVGQATDLKMDNLLNVAQTGNIFVVQNMDGVGMGTVIVLVTASSTIEKSSMESDVMEGAGQTFYLVTDNLLSVTTTLHSSVVQILDDAGAVLIIVNAMAV